MDFTKLGGFKAIYYLVSLIVFVVLMVFLLRSVKESLCRIGGRWQSVIDEIFIGFIVLIAFTTIAQIEPSLIISFLTKPLKWIWDLVLKALRFVGAKIQRAIIKSAYSYTVVETHKQKLYVPYTGIELNGWGMVLVTLGGLLPVLIPIGISAYYLFGSLGILLSIVIAVVSEIDAVMFLTEIGQESRKNKPIVLYCRDVKNYHIPYDSQGHTHRLSKEREGRVHRCVRWTLLQLWRRKHRLL